MKKRILPLLLSLIFAGILQAFGQQQENLKAIAKLDSISRAAPREKLYLHFDKNVYTTRDTLWFKAYLFDLSLKSASIQSGIIYAEIIDAKGNIIKTVGLPTGGGLTWGGFALDPKFYNTGTYIFRAYTNWMLNFGDRYVFKREFKIVNLTETGTSTAVATSGNGTTQNSNNSTSNGSGRRAIDVQFLPEGGTWIAEQQQLMAFKAIAANGKGIVVKGEIQDSKQNKAVAFSTNRLGMGTFIMTPKAGETYTAVFFGETIKNEQLPKAQTSGVNLRVKNSFSSDSIKIIVNSNLVNTELILMGQSRGLISFLVKIKPNVSTKTLTLNKNIFPSGISQISVFNRQYQGIAERSFFINHNDHLQISTDLGSSSFSIRDSIPLKLVVTNAGNTPIIGSFSIAITDDSQVFKDEINDSNILTYFLLTSDLTGDIENPGYYFNQFNAEKHDDLEALMLSQGWTSYLMKPIKKTNFIVEKDFTISGNVSNLSNTSAAKINVSLFGKNRGKTIAMQTTTNEKGEFIFDNFPALDTTAVVIQALNAKGRKGSLGIKVNEFKSPPYTASISYRPSDVAQKKGETVDVMLKNQRETAIKADGISLNTVNIVAKKIIKNSKNLNGPGEADQIIDAEELEKATEKTLYDLLYEKVPGFAAKVPMKSEDKEFFIKSNRSKFIIDGMDLDYFYEPLKVRDDHFRYIKSYLDGYKASDIMGIEVMTSLNNTTNYDVEFDLSASLQNAMKGQFSSYIEITTRSGSGPFLKKIPNIFFFKPIPYGDTKVFYSPKYNAVNKSTKVSDLRSTIYWVPNLITNEKGEARTSFYSSDKKGTYTIWIEGSDMQGNIGMKMVKVNIN